MEQNERLFCWEQVQAANPLFRISRVFAPEGQAGRLLPLYALFAVLERLCSNRSDVDVARRKLDWWRGECLQGEFERSAHPVLREFVASGAVRSVDRNLLVPLFDSVDARLDAQPTADFAALERLCRSVAEPQLALELAVCAGRDAPASTALAAHLPHVGLAQLLRESARSAQDGRFWWLPLNLLARHGISRAQLEQDPDAAAGRALFSDILDCAQRWGEAAAQANTGREIRPAAQHFVVSSQLQGCALHRLRKTRPTKYASALTRVGARELLLAWRAARRVSRP
jgi:phytoene synthase